MARAVLSVSVDFPLAELVRREAERTGQTESAIVAEALRRFFGTDADAEAPQAGAGQDRPELNVARQV